MDEQFKLFIKNIGLERDALDDIYNDSLFIYICKAIAKELDDYQMRDKAVAALEILRDLSD